MPATLNLQISLRGSATEDFTISAGSPYNGEKALVEFTVDPAKIVALARSVDQDADASQVISGEPGAFERKVLDVLQRIGEELPGKTHEHLRASTRLVARGESIAKALPS